MNLLVFGLGFTAGFYASHAAGAFAKVTGTQRAPQANRIGDVTVLPFDSAMERVDEWLFAALAGADAILVSAAPGRDGDPVLRRLKMEIEAAPKLKKIVYLSTVGVYGDADGQWIDETAPLNPTTERNRQRVVAEGDWLELGKRSGKGVYVLRLSGIYGPGRNVLLKLRDGTAKRLVKPSQVFNRIHVADIARAIDACLLRDTPSGVYNVTDDEPAPPQDVVLFGAQLLGIAPPPEQDFDAAKLTPMQRSFYGENKRVSNAKMKCELGVTLAFPTYREGVGSLVADVNSA